MTTRFQLPPRLDHQGARQLHALLVGARGTEVRLDASKVTFVGALALQVLLAALARWRADGLRLSCDQISPAFADDIARLGADPSELHEDLEPCR